MTPFIYYLIPKISEFNQIFPPSVRNLIKTPLNSHYTPWIFVGDINASHKSTPHCLPAWFNHSTLDNTKSKATFQAIYICGRQKSSNLLFTLFSNTNFHRRQKILKRKKKIFFISVSEWACSGWCLNSIFLGMNFFNVLLNILYN